MARKNIIYGALILGALILGGSRTTILANTIRLNVENGSNITQELNEALMKAAKSGTKSKPAKVVVPEGRYVIDGMLHIFSNTTLDLSDDVQLVAKNDGTRFNMLLFGTNGTYDGYEDYNNSEATLGYEGFENIFIKGGTFKGANTNGAVLVRGAHGRNIKFEDVIFEGGGGLHQMEIAAVDGLEMEDCQFRNFGTQDNQGKKMEALQLDVVCDNVAFPAYNQDGTPLKNVELKRCIFNNVPRGVGGHNMLMGAYFDNIVIDNCKFTNIKEEAIVAINWKNAKIINNIISNCRSGIVYETFRTDKTVQVYTTIWDGTVPYEGEYITQFNSVIEDNLIKVTARETSDTVVGVKLYGYDNSAKQIKGRYGIYIPQKNYKIQKIKVLGNTIETSEAGFYLVNVSDSQFENNDVKNKTKTSISKSKRKGKKITVSWKKQAQADGYQIFVATNKGFTKNLKKYSVSKKKTSFSFSANKKKKYYIKVRGYIKRGDSKTFCTFSKTQTVKGKK